MDALKDCFCYPWMQDREVSSIYGCSKGLILLSVDAGYRIFRFPWMQDKKVSAILGYRIAGPMIAETILRCIID